MKKRRHEHPRTSQHYVSLVGQRLRGLGALEKENHHANVLMHQTILRLKILAKEWRAKKAVPPNLKQIHKLEPRHKQIFELWMQNMETALIS
mmetsp:Transcript_13147/g.32110  ORF Transcript_13147/g.32110 Transcript_13147/m.32110 type:complete len:92 (+) Transcript_13147:612-887(+)|eukprot:CAMPEP_0178981788 /NCGR_PEP_ID=MMETSP0795-20121207/133_1 /TAXON_ID=88552 /ORGANISM="Amoebophrya sp., Strain Ameob2" /LENGTH=91 /DNA_ID=CAMNT_0020672357 /DNA_START=771 /DNA_END=1046 /DNA_ORIENTATION=+